MDWGIKLMKSILVVDDEATLRMLIVDSLEDLDCTIDEAESGLDALNKINGKKYDVIILDYMMPELTGIEVLEQIDKNIISETMIVMLTAKTQEKDQQQAKAAGVDIFMKKPFSPMELYRLVEELTHD